MGVFRKILQLNTLQFLNLYTSCAIAEYTHLIKNLYSKIILTQDIINVLIYLQLNSRIFYFRGLEKFIKIPYNYNIEIMLDVTG